MDANTFANKVAVITGGGSGIGLATARLLKSRGAAVAIIGRDANRLEQARRELGEDVLALPGDVSRPGDIEDCLLGVEVRFGRIDILFANAGLSECPPLRETGEAFFDRIIGVNLKGVFFTFTLALPLLAQGASVIFTCSAAHGRGRPGDPLYSAAKAAVRSLARTLAADEEVLAKGIRINVISPGAIRTPLTARAGREAEVNAWIEGAVPMGRWGEAREVARAVAFLASSESSYTTGSELAVDGGLAQI